MAGSFNNIKHKARAVVGRGEKRESLSLLGDPGSEI